MSTVPAMLSDRPHNNAVGIDLGTTNSLVAVLRDGKVVVISGRDGERLTPSVVAFPRAGGFLVGHNARRQAVANPDRTVYSVKRQMGQDTIVTVGNVKYTPQEISARILQKLKRDAEAYLGEPVTEAVVTVPAYFDEAQRSATKEAADLAGLKVLRIVQEPAAAAMALSGVFDDSAMIVVLDLGGGTLDVSVVDTGEGVFEVKSTHGNTRLGGNDWDQRIVDWLVEEFKTTEGIDLSKDNMALQRLREAAEEAKIELSSAHETRMHLPFIAHTNEGTRHLDMKLSRARFQELSADLVEVCRGSFEQAIKDAGLTKACIDHVVLVGGSTRMPAIQELVYSVTGQEPHRDVNPDEVVVVGAAIQAGVLKGEVKDVLLLDVTPLSLGIETNGGVMTKLIERNETIPTKRSEVFTTAEDMQPSVEIHVLQGEREMAMYNKTLGKFQLVDLPPAPRGVPRIEVTFEIDANGMVYVSARDQASGKRQAITVTGLPQDPGRLRRMARRMRRDMREVTLIELRNDAQSFLLSVRQQIEDVDLSPDEAATLQARMGDLETILLGTDPQLIKDSVKSLHALWDNMQRDSLMASSNPFAFLSYVREDSITIHKLRDDLRRGGVRVWTDTHELAPGDRWKDEVRRAITNGGHFLACFSKASVARDRTYMNEELNVAIEEARLRPPNRAWLIPVLLDRCHVPDRDIGGGARLSDLQQVRLYESWDAEVKKLIRVLKS